MYWNGKTYFSFRYGTYRTEELVLSAVSQGVNVLGLTNINNTCDAWDFVKQCRKAGIKPILGAEIRNGDQLLYILLAANNAGFAWINRFLSLHLVDKQPFPELPGDQAFFDNTADGYVIYPLGTKPLDALFPNERIGVLPSEVNKLFSLPVKDHADKLVVRQPVTFQNKTSYNVHRLLRAIDKNTLLSKLPVAATASPEEHFVAPSKLLEAFKDLTFIVTNTYKLMDSCSIEMNFGVDKNKTTFSATKEDDRILLQKLALDGFALRYKKNKKAEERLHRELKIINDQHFNSYFLITLDMIRYAQSRGFYYVGRGSGANSMVAYCLQITDVDPIELNLYFERFLNPERSSPPDFDMDFSWLDRDEIIDYMFKRYGKQHVALLGMYTTFQYRAVVRELGKVFGLPKEEIDALADKTGSDDKIHKMISQYSELIKNFPNHLSIHPGGILISEKPIDEYCTVTLPPKGFVTAQLDMYVAESIGLFKLDVLSQRGLGHIKESLRLIRQNHGIDVNIRNVAAFKKDPKVRAQIKTVNTIGCFYIESPAMRQLLRKLECDDYLTLVAASSIIRPGVAQSGMMRAYIERYHARDKVVYLHPLFEEHLSETFGIMVFQEDVIKIAHYYAGLTLGEADVLRRAMSGKYRSDNTFLMIKAKFFAGAKVLGREETVSAEVWRQMESFAGYSFNKAHSASFAVESYQSLYLKTYYPKEFMVAVINNFGGFYSRELYFLELRKTGANIHLPCVNNSEQFTNITGNEVYMGFVHMKSLEQNTIDTLITERTMNGDYLHLQNFIERTNISREQLNILVSIGAFRFTHKSKKTLLWEANFLQKKNATHFAASESLFEETPMEFTLPDFKDLPLDDLYDQIEILDFPLANPFEMVDDDCNEYIYAKDLKAQFGKIVTVLIYFIDNKIVTTANGQTMALGTFLDANLDWVDTVHFPDAYRNYPIKGKGFYRATGKVIQDFGVYNIDVHKIVRVGYKPRSYANL